MNTIVVQWDKLEEHQKALVVAMINNVHGLDDVNDNGRLMHNFWIQADVLDPRCGYDAEGESVENTVDGSDQLWDVFAEQTSFDNAGKAHVETLLKLTGMRGPSGSGGEHCYVFPPEIQIRLGAKVRR